MIHQAEIDFFRFLVSAANLGPDTASRPAWLTRPAELTAKIHEAS